MSQLRQSKFLIIGAGVAAVSAAQAIRSVNPTGEITLVSEDPFGYYSRPGLAYYLTGELEEKQLFPFTQKELKALDLRFVHDRVVRIEPDRMLVGLERGTWLPYERLLIATGSQAVPLKVPGVESAGVYKLDNMTDARSILSMANRAKTAVVTGGGITALELVEGLRARGLQVHYFLRGSRYWSNVLDETESHIVEGRLRHLGVRIHPNTEIVSIRTEKGRVKAAVIQDGREVGCQMLAYAIGVKPRLELAQSIGIETERGILTNEYMQTSRPHIYAAGDVAQAFDPFSGQRVIDTLWAPALEQGHVAGLNMAGQTVTYRKSAPLNVTRLSELTVTIIGTVGRGKDPSLEGIARGDSETWRMLPDSMTAETIQDVNRLRLMLGKDRILGAIVMGDQSLSLPLQELINQGADITGVRDEMIQTDHLGECVARFWTKWRAEHAREKS